MVPENGFSQTLIGITAVALILMSALSLFAPQISPMFIAAIGVFGFQLFIGE